MKKQRVWRILWMCVKKQYNDFVLVAWLNIITGEKKHQSVLMLNRAIKPLAQDEIYKAA